MTAINGKQLLYWVEDNLDWLWKLILLIFVFISIVYVILPWWASTEEQVKKYREEHPLLPSPAETGYELKFDGPDVKKVWAYDNRGLEYVETFTKDGWDIASQQTLYSACWNFATCDEYVLELAH